MMKMKESVIIIQVLSGSLISPAWSHKILNIIAAWWWVWKLPKTEGVTRLIM